MFGLNELRPMPLGGNDSQTGVRDGSYREVIPLPSKLNIQRFYTNVKVLAKGAGVVAYGVPIAKMKA